MVYLRTWRFIINEQYNKYESFAQWRNQCYAQEDTNTDLVLKEHLYYKALCLIWISIDSMHYFSPF